ncbi:MAG: hypothetical protein HYV26_09870, partial [Candidatus Hydrogenedentes bacterium]|nr:hypothetical protein [Candidatus Hydrogenedentota bacterium]
MNPLLILSKDSLTHGIWTYLLRGRGYRVIEATLDELGKEDAPIPFEPALIIYDFHPATPLTEGLDSLEMLADLCPGIPLVLLLPASWPSAHKKMFQEYASGYLTK